MTVETLSDAVCTPSAIKAALPERNPIISFAIVKIRLAIREINDTRAAPYSAPLQTTPLKTKATLVLSSLHELITIYIVC